MFGTLLTIFTVAVAIASVESQTYLVRYPIANCSETNTFDEKTCFIRRACVLLGGLPVGSCANNLGVYCIFQKSCGTTASINNTYFTNPNYPLAYSGGDQCSLKIQKCNPNVCQLRIDFVEFSLAQPTSEGVCDPDLLVISDGSGRTLRICGENSNQHVYVDFVDSNSISIAIGTSADYVKSRRWNIKIQQMACDSSERGVCNLHDGQINPNLLNTITNCTVILAPSGCLQYYTSKSDTVTSFNYDTSSNPRTGAASVIGTREIANLNYGVCVKAAEGYCSIRWSATSDTSFSTTGDASAATGTPVDTGCKTDYVIIPNPTEVNTNLPAESDRFCGTNFTSKITSAKPYVLYVVTDNTETSSTPADIQNKGFSLAYKQVLCSL